jgi:hypothetical protein
MIEGTRKATKTRSFRQEIVGDTKVLRPIGRRHAIWTLSHPLCISRWEESFQPPDEGLQNLPKVAKCHGFKPRSTIGRKKHKSGIPNATTRKTVGVKSIYISNDPTGAKVQERAEEHIQTCKPGNIIPTRYYKVPAMVRSTS